jgi:5-methyltetrahydropteroyltriglutamate--homocysteine methyltransferase
MIVRLGLTSAFPRSEALIVATRDLDRGRATAREAEEAYERAEREVVALERRLGLDALTGGYLRWADLLRPFAETWDGFTVGPLTRWFETNTFYRQPILHAPPGRTVGAIAGYLPAHLKDDRGRVAVRLPGPYTFAGLLENRSGEADVAIIHRLGRLLGEEVRELHGLGYRNFQFSDPLIAVRPPEGPTAEAVLAGYESIRQSLNGSTSIVWTYGADAKDAFPLLDRLPVSAVGMDLSETDWESWPEGRRVTGLGLGVLDSRTTLVEEPTEVARLVRAIYDRRRPPVIWLGPGGPLDLLPWEPAVRKTEVLPRAREALGLGSPPP